ncbi:MAG: DUF3124 domain-containing protein [Hyphomicrobiales bacterium]|nr:DUF3124 domain-containing protein [Hyphomicrobiales bacterium]
MRNARTAIVGCLGLLALITGIEHAGAQGGAIERDFAASLTDVPRQPLSVSGSVYVPAYSSVSMVPGRLKADFSVTLSIHNSSREKPLVLRRISYFDTSGTLVEDYLQRPIALRPFATIEIFIAQTDVRGGTGANFIVDWTAAGRIAEPVAETLMIGSIGAGHYAFISPGRQIQMRDPN